MSDEYGNIVVIGAENKLAETRRIIQEADRKVVIMCPFTAIQYYLIEKLRKDYRIGHINGGTPGDKRHGILQDFQGDKLDLLICHPRVTRYGLNMNAGSHMIWFGPVYSALDFEQGSFRIRGPGTGKTWYVKLSASPIEREIFNIVENRMKDQEDTMSMADNLIANDLTKLYKDLRVAA